MNDTILAVLAEQIRELGYRRVSTEDGSLYFVCAMNSRYEIRIIGGYFHCCDPFSSLMERHELADPDSVERVANWARRLRRHWRMARKMIEHYQSRKVQLGEIYAGGTGRSEHRGRAPQV